MKKIVSLFFITLIIFNSFLITAAAEAEERTLSLEGNYTLFTEVDEAYVSVGLKTFNLDFKLCQEENKEKMNNVIEGIKKLGIDEKYIKTTTYDSQMVYEYIKRDYHTGIYYNGSYDYERVFKGYELTHFIQIKLTDVSMVGKVIDLTVEMGVNDLNSVSFNLSEEKKNQLYLEALEKASKNAQDKANVLAKSFGINNLKIKNISVTRYSIYTPTSYSVSSPVLDSYNKGAGNDTSTSIIYGGEVQIQASVNVIYTY